ncbi:MAG: hypothetical protein Q6353_001895 [Candidatus Sigynarchaeum springense]
MKRVRILGHRPATIAIVLLSLLFAACSCVSALIALVAWLNNMPFDWSWP